MNIAYTISLFHFIIQLTEAGASSHLGPNVLLDVGEELRPELDLVPSLLLLMEVPNVQENLQRVGLVTTRSVKVRFFNFLSFLNMSVCYGGYIY